MATTTEVTRTTVGEQPTIVFAVPQTTSQWLCILVPALLFALLAPGGLLHIPPPQVGPYKGQIFTPGALDWRAIIVHTLVFGFIYWLLITIFPQIRCC